MNGQSGTFLMWHGTSCLCKHLEGLVQRYSRLKQTWVSVVWEEFGLKSFTLFSAWLPHGNDCLSLLYKSEKVDVLQHLKVWSFETVLTMECVSVVCHRNKYQIWESSLQAEKQSPRVPCRALQACCLQHLLNLLLDLSLVPMLLHGRTSLPKGSSVLLWVLYCQAIAPAFLGSAEQWTQWSK